MPLFEFKCTKCGYVTTFLEKLNSKVAEHKCSKCGSLETKKIFSKVTQKKENSTVCETGTCPFS